MSYTYEYPRPCVTVDVALFRKHREEEEILLIQRKNPPFEGSWALPGGFINMDENLSDAAYRELKEETGLAPHELFQFRTYGDVHRDPRHRTISIVYYGFMEFERSQPTSGDDASRADWFPIQKLPPLAFDHTQIINDLIEYLKLNNLIVS